jgi:hypothetical protein
MDEQKAQIREVLEFMKSEDFKNLPEDKQQEITEKAKLLVENFKKSNPDSVGSASAEPTVEKQQAPKWIMNYL